MKFPNQPLLVRRLISPLVTLLLAAAPAFCPPAAHGDPLRRESVSQNAHWLIHLDLEEFRRSEAGRFLLEQWGPKLTNSPVSPVPLPVDQIQSITAYGSSYKGDPESDGVLMLTATRAGISRIRALFDKPPAPLDGLSISVTAHAPVPTYVVNKEVRVVFASDQQIVLSKSTNALEHALEVLRGSRPSLKSTNTFDGYRSIEHSLFFLAVAEGFSSHAAIPPQARVLQMAQGGRVVLGEHDGKIFADISLRTPDSKASQQIQQITQGLLALAVLSQGKHPELMELAASARVQSSENHVSLTVHLPVSMALQHLREKDADRTRSMKATASDDAEKAKTDSKDR